jgi:hypothetical protein
MKTLDKKPVRQNIKVSAILNGMNNNPQWEIKDNDAAEVMSIYNSMQTGSYMNTRSESNRFYNGCTMEVSSNKSIHVFDGYAILNENNIIEVRIDKNQCLEKQLLKNLKAAPMVKNLIFNSDLSRDLEINKAV